jgi:putative transposase
MVRPSQRKEACIWAVEDKQLPVSRACRLFGLSVSGYRHVAVRPPDDEIKDQLLRLSETHRRWGFGLCFAWLRNQGHRWNHKKVYRVYTDLRLNLRIKPKRRIPSRNPEKLATPDFPNHCWSVDFMSDSLIDGRQFRTFNVLEDFNRESLMIDVGHSMPGERVVRALEQLSRVRGYPSRLRSDNGPEFISTTLAEWAEKHHVVLDFIKPGKPTQNSYIERFNRTFREEILDAYAFSDLGEVEDVSTQWRLMYNEERPHTALGGRPPAHHLRLHVAAKEAEARQGALPLEPQDLTHVAHPGEGRSAA